MQLSEYAVVTFYVKENQGLISCTKGGTMYGDWLANYVIHLFIYMFGTTIKMSLLFKFWGHLSQRRILEKNTLL